MDIIENPNRWNFVQLRKQKWSPWIYVKPKQINKTLSTLLVFFKSRCYQKDKEA